jgi:transcriptional regulator of acetoin/glycerol metabolism
MYDGEGTTAASHHRRNRSSFGPDAPRHGAQRFTFRSSPAKYRAALRRPRKLPDLPGLDEVLREHVLHVLEACGGNGRKAARILDIDRKTLYSMLRRWRAQPPR